jgi:hypothetical protein
MNEGRIGNLYRYVSWKSVTLILMGHCEEEEGSCFLFQSGI